MSPAIKSWKNKNEQQLLSVLVDLVAALTATRKILDLQVEEEAATVEARLQGFDIAYIRKKPSQEPLHRAQRHLGIYTGRSSLSVAVRLRDGAEAKSLLAGDVLWNADFILYPEPSENLHQLPDPHLLRNNFVTHVDWSLGQETGASDWILTGNDATQVDHVLEILMDAFSTHGLFAEVR